MTRTGTPAGADVVVIGSGIAGSRVAMEVSEAGGECLVLEAGADHGREDFPLSEARMVSELYWSGGLELSKGGSVVFTRGKCVGGGSVVNQALLDRLDETVLQEWRDVSGVGWLRPESMTPVYRTVEADMKIREIEPGRFNGNSLAVHPALDALGIPWRVLRRAEAEECERQDCIRCLGGCPRGSKQSTPETTLKRALRAGAVVVPHVHVDQLAADPDGVTIHGVGPGGRRSFRTRQVVLAAGSIGTTAILLRSGFGRGRPHLGGRFHCHPQFMTTAVIEPGGRQGLVDAHRGAFQALTCSFGSEAGQSEYKLETNFVPPIVYHTLLSGVGSSVYRAAEEYRTSVGMEICVRDREPGRISVDRRGRPVLSKELGEADRAAWRTARAQLTEVYARLGARSMRFSPKAFSVHPMGGCTLGSSSDRGSVSGDFRLFGEDRIFVADSSLFPTAPGRNPSLTVMALASRCARELLEKVGSSVRGVAPGVGKPALGSLTAAS